MKTTLTIIVSGRVQGVYFRANTQKQAHALGITGTVRNLPSGEVEIIATGNTDQLQALIKWCHKGPLLAKVTAVKVTESRLDDQYSAFEIR